MADDRTTADRAVETLEALDVEYVFGYPGGRVIELFEAIGEDGSGVDRDSSSVDDDGANDDGDGSSSDEGAASNDDGASGSADRAVSNDDGASGSADRDSSVEIVRPRDEREASVMAEAYGRLTGEPAVLAGQGPWIGSLGSIGQMEARLGSSPMVALTEASERGDYSTLAPYQQSRGDYGGLSLPKILDGVTKEWWFPRTPTETVRSVQLAFKHATAGRPGPCAVVFDGNAIADAFPDEATPPVWDDDEQVRNWDARPTERDLEAALEALADADRPAIVAGNGVHAADAYDELLAVADRYDAVVTTSYLGKSTIPETHERAAGVIGSFGHEGANRVASEADVLLIVGCRMNPMDSNWQADSFVRPDEQTILHADVDSRNAGWVYPADVGLIGDAAETLAALAAAGDPSAGDRSGESHTAEDGWGTDRAAEAAEDFSVPECDADATPIKPQRACKALEAVVDEDTVVTADSGNNRFWLLNYLRTPAVGTYYGSGGVGGMGWAPPAAVTAALLGNDAVCVAGDGGFGMTMTAIETAVQNDVAPAFIVLNDASLGMVRQMDDAIPGTGFPDTDFVGVARALGGDGVRVTDPGDLVGALRNAKGADVPTVVDVAIDPDEAMADQLASSFYEEVGGLHE